MDFFWWVKILFLCSRAFGHSILFVSILLSNPFEIETLNIKNSHVICADNFEKKGQHVIKWHLLLEIDLCPSFAFQKCCLLQNWSSLERQYLVPPNRVEWFLREKIGHSASVPNCLRIPNPKFIPKKLLIPKIRIIFFYLTFLMVAPETKFVP